MDIGALLIESLKLLVLGMGFVYILLGIMVYAIKLLARLAAESTPHAEPGGLPPPSPVPHSQLNLRVVAAIAAAVHKFRRPRS